MTRTTLWLFIVMTFFVSGTPGPNMLLIMATSARHGLRAAISAMSGCMTALLVMMGISTAGLGAVLQAFPFVFDALRVAGAVYLAYLGVQCWRAPLGQTNANDLGTAFVRQGFWVALSNPKAILFAAAFFPQFINPQADKLPQFALLLATFVVIEVSWYFIYAIGGQWLSAYLQRPSVMQGFNRLTGSVFVGFAALMVMAFVQR
ncbi:MAG: LysE family translocator [Rhodoferax sp.]|nr:LysE family translocator [Rhodoferax sp.]